MTASRVNAPASATISASEIARAARILSIRTRREATGLFSGAYASAFRGSGMEFEESRPYVPGDDIRCFDWNAMARTGEPFVKLYRQERDLCVWIALDVSASMRFGTQGVAKAETAAHAAALLAAAAGKAGDRIGLLAFDSQIRAEVSPARGPAHTWELIRTAASCAGEAEGGTRIGNAVETLLSQAGARSTCVILSDFRDPTLFGETQSGASSALLGLARRHDVVCGVLHDPREESLPKAGLLRIEDPERPGRRLVLNSNRATTRARYRRAWAARSQALERGLRASGADVVWLRSDRDILRTWMNFFRERGVRTRGAA